MGKLTWDPQNQTTRLIPNLESAANMIKGAKSFIINGGSHGEFKFDLK